MTMFQAKMAAPTSDIVNVMLSGLQFDQASTLCTYIQEAMNPNRKPQPVPNRPVPTIGVESQLGSKKRVMS